MNEKIIEELARFERELVEVYAHIKALDLYFSRNPPHLHKSDREELRDNIDTYINILKGLCTKYGGDIKKHEDDLMEIYIAGISEMYDIIDILS